MKMKTVSIVASFSVLVLWALSSVSGSECKVARTNNLSLEAVRRRYENWAERHGRSYESSEEKERRFQIYHSHVVFIESVNSQNLSFKLADNKFADMTNAEYRSALLGTKPRFLPPTSFRYERRHEDSPESVDWRNGSVTPVKNQGLCGCCWAFSSVAAVEGINQIKSGTLVSLSEQELVDCDIETGNLGCNGGFMETAFEFVKRNGLTTEDAYPYAERNNKCESDKLGKDTVTIAGYETVPRNDEDSLRSAVLNQPISVAIDAGSYEFQFYSSGVFSGRCGTDLNHGVTLVGYGEERGQRYWTVKNSWGLEWGEAGYVRIHRGLGTGSPGTCGIAMLPSYPVMD